MSEQAKYLLFEGLTNFEGCNKLISFINENAGNLVIGINSGGGESFYATFLLKQLNENKDRITLVATCGVYSSAFYLFYNFQGRKVITIGSRGMWHLGRADITFSENLKPYFHEGKSDMDMLKEVGRVGLKFAESFMTPKELAKFHKNKDVYFTFSRMKQIFPDAEII